MVAQENIFWNQLFMSMIFMMVDSMHSLADQQRSKDLTHNQFGNLHVPVAIVPDQMKPRGERHARSNDNSPNSCYPDEYWSDLYRKCKWCTRCSPGTEHSPPEYCGNGQGQETRCNPCQDGYFQTAEGINVPPCQRCSVCDPRATTEAACNRRSDTLCGKCQDGWYYYVKNVCVECTESDIADPLHEDCYDEPDPTPVPQPVPGPEDSPGPQASPGLQSTPRPIGDGTSSEPATKPLPLNISSAQPENGLSILGISLIVGVSALAIVIVLGTFFIITRRWKKKNENKDAVAAAAENDQRIPLKEGVNENLKDQQPRNPAGRSLPIHVPPSSYQDSSGKKSVSQDPNSCIGIPNDIPDTDDMPTRNYVKPGYMYELDSDPGPGPSSNGPFSIPRSLKSCPNEVDNGPYRASAFAPAGAHAITPTGAKPTSENNDDVGDFVRPASGHDIAAVGNYNVDQSDGTGFLPLSSRLEHNVRS